MRRSGTALVRGRSRSLLCGTASLKFLAELFSLGAVLAGFGAQFDDCVTQFPYFILKLADRLGHRIGWRCGRCGHCLREPNCTARQKTQSRRAEFSNPSG